MSLIDTYQRIIREAGGPENLADMLICESPEFFGFGEFNAAKKRLIKKKRYYVSPLKAQSFTRQTMIVKPFVRKSDPLNCKKWTTQDVEFLYENIDDMPYCEIAAKLDRTLEATYSKAVRLGLRKYRDLKNNKAA